MPSELVKTCCCDAPQTITAQTLSFVPVLIIYTQLVFFIGKWLSSVMIQPTGRFCGWLCRLVNVLILRSPCSRGTRRQREGCGPWRMERFYRPGREALGTALASSWLAPRHLVASNFRQAGKRFLALFLGRSGNRSRGCPQPLAWENDPTEETLESRRRELLAAPQE